MGCGVSRPAPVQDEAAAYLPATRTAKKDSSEPTARLLDSYVVGSVLGQGAFGIVYACRPRGSDEERAVKMVDRVETPVEKITEEANFLKKMDHPNCIKCFDVIYEKCFVCIVMQRLRGGDLITAMQTHWKSKGTIPLQATIRAVRQMASSLSYLHGMFLVHRDVKGDNYLCDRPEVEHPNLHVVLTDFGTVSDCPPGTRLGEKCGTKLFWSPEFYNRDYGIKVDIWAMGVVYYGLLNGRFPFRNEDEVRTKVVNLSDSTPPDCKKLLQATLEKDDGSRIAAEKILEHSFLKSGGVPFSEPVAPSSHASEIGQDETEVMREIGAHGGVQERRQELVERLQDVYMKVSTQMSMSTSFYRSSTIEDRHYCKDKFTVKAPRDHGVIVYEWWDADKVAKELDVHILAGTKGSPEIAENSKNISTGACEKMLKDFGIDVSKFGQGKAKSLAHLAEELHSGASVLMLDATRHKSLVRVVNVVCLRIKAPKGNTKFMIEIGEQWADGRKREIPRLPGSKKEPHENSRQTAERIVKETMASVGKMKVKFDWAKKELYEEEEESPSFPGVRTVYRKEIIEGTVTNERGSSKREASKREGSKKTLEHQETIPGWNMDLTKTGVELQKEDKNHNVKFYKWITEKECKQRGIPYKAPAEGMELSGLIQAPIGMDEEALGDMIQSHGIDVTKFGVGQAKSLAELSAELIHGESILSEDPRGQLVRIVDIVVIKLVHPDGRILVEVKHIHADGRETELKRLPGAKRRPDENQFLTVRRMLKRSIRMDEDHVIMRNRDVEVVEEDKTSVGYPQLRTVYRKRIIPATLASKVAEVETD